MILKTVIEIVIFVCSILGIFMYLIIAGGKLGLSDEEIETDKQDEIKWLNDIEKNKKEKRRKCK